jgi:hypothetical protein
MCQSSSSCSGPIRRAMPIFELTWKAFGTLEVEAEPSPLIAPEHLGRRGL